MTCFFADSPLSGSVWRLSQLVLLAELRANPCRTLGQFAEVLSSAGWNCNGDFVRSRFSLHGISLKLAKRKHRNKFAIKNILYTGQYLAFIRGVVDWHRVKFVDESSYESKCELCCVQAVVLPFCSHSQLCCSFVRCLSRWRLDAERAVFVVRAALFAKRGWAEKDRELHVMIGAGEYGAKTVSITCVTTLDDPTGTFISNPRVGTNKAEHWLEFVLRCIQQRVSALPLLKLSARAGCCLTVVVFATSGADCWRHFRCRQLPHPHRRAHHCAAEGCAGGRGRSLRAAADLFS